MLIRRLRVCGYDPFTDKVDPRGQKNYRGVPERVIPAPAEYAAQFTDVVCINYKSGRLHFLAEVIGSPSGDPYMTTGMAAELLGVNRRTVARWAESGRLDAKRTAGGKKREGSWRVTVESVRRRMADPSLLDAGAEARRFVADVDRPTDRTKRGWKPTRGQVGIDGTIVGSD